MARIGIYGGTFNPIHKTHIEIAKAALEQFSLDSIIFLVAGDPPHKQNSSQVTPFMRLDMVKLAIKNYPKFSVDDREVLRAGKSYSYLTFRELKSEYPNDQLFFIMGGDSLTNFKNWVKPEEISSLTTILAAPRTGDDKEALISYIEEYSKIYEGKFKLIDYKANAIASTDIRKDIFYAEDALDPEVFAYINEHNLYLNLYSYDTVLSLSKKMKDELKNSRYIHTLGVASTAYSLGLKWNYPAYNAMVAGMLHDCAKCLSDEKRINICKDNNIPISEIEGRFPHLLHGKVGAYLAKKKYGIEDNQILHAIAIHTTGCVNMNLLDKIIFVADYIEPGRQKQPRLDTLRKVAYEDLDLCVFMILEDTVNYLSDTPDSIDSTTIETYKFYKELRGEL